MLFTYKYINHEIEKFQAYMDFLFFNVWLTAEGEFDTDKLDGNPALKQIYIDLATIDFDPNDDKKNQKGKSAYLFSSSIEKIYEEFAKIDDENFKQSISQFYSNNNNIQALCEDKTISPISYKQIKAQHPELSNALENLYKKLYTSESPFNLDVFGQLSKKILPEHYNNFVKENDEDICPFCGLHKIKGLNHKKKEAYDHFIPKAVYPFNSINFKNLAPMCHECNSSYKGTKEPIYKDYRNNPDQKEQKRQLAFYPYDQNHPDITINLKLNSKDIKNLKPADIDLSITCTSHQEQINSWKRVYGIDERYKALVCCKNGATEWFADVYDDFENAQSLDDIQSAEKYYQKVIRATNRNNKLATNILKRKFLQECKHLNLFEVQLPETIDQN